MQITKEQLAELAAKRERIAKSQMQRIDETMHPVIRQMIYEFGNAALRIYLQHPTIKPAEMAKELGARITEFRKRAKAKP